jgi:hypothetical protein
MTFKELQAAGRKMTPEERVAILEMLCQDPRFGAVVNLLEFAKATFVSGACQPEMAPNHGAMAHAMGQICAVEWFESQICERAGSS